LGGWQSICDSPLPGRRPQRNRRIARSESSRLADRRTPGSGHRREFIRLHGLPARKNADRRKSKSNLQHSRARAKTAGGGRPNPEPRGADDGASNQWVHYPRTIADATERTGNYGITFSEKRDASPRLPHQGI